MIPGCRLLYDRGWEVMMMNDHATYTGAAETNEEVELMPIQLDTDDRLRAEANAVQVLQAIARIAAENGLKLVVDGPSGRAIVHMGSLKITDDVVDAVGVPSTERC